MARQDLPDPLPSVGVTYVAAACVMMATMWILAVMLVLSGRSLLTHRSHSFCVKVAAIVCVFVPLGTALGVSTLLVLNRSSVRGLFGVNRAGAHSR